MARKSQPSLPTLFLMLSAATSSFAFSQDAQSVHQQDQLPTGEASPEAAACDMVRALVSRNYQGFIASTPAVGPGTKTDNDYMNHYVSLVTNTSFQTEDGIVTAHDLLQRARLRLTRVSPAVAIQYPKYSSHGVLGTSSQHNFVDVTVGDRKTAQEYTTRMLVLYRADVEQWKAYPIPHPNNELYRAINAINTGTKTHSTESTGK